MSPLPLPVQKYLAKFTVSGPWHLAGNPRQGCAGAVVIPALAEGDSLFGTLESLAANPPEWFCRYLIVVVINHGEYAQADVRRQNAEDLNRLASLAENSELNLTWVDAATAGFELPDKLAGVGFARKLGIDLTLEQLDWTEGPIVVCLDADTLVQADYLQAISAHFQSSRQGAAVLPFRHQDAADPLQQAAIDRYELFLRSYVYGLTLAGSPYAFNTVGSAIACLAISYVRCGGMNCRKAGEDFYFLQKLAKTDGVEPLSGTTVYPAPRISSRVPFGTGRSMGDLLAGQQDAVLFYPVAVFKILAGWLNIATTCLSEDAQTLLRRATQVSSSLTAYLTHAGLEEVWPRLQATHSDPQRRLKAFHVWFDGFRTMRLIHHLCEADFCRGEPETLLPDYFLWQGRPSAEGVVAMLKELRLRDRS